MHRMARKTGYFLLMGAAVFLLLSQPTMAQVEKYGIGGEAEGVSAATSGVVKASSLSVIDGTRAAFNGRAEHSTGIFGLYYLVTGGKFVNGQTVNGDNASGGVFRFIHDDPVSNAAYPGAYQTWARDDWFPENAGWAMTLKNDDVIVYDNNGIETHTTEGFYDDSLTSIAGLYMGYGMSNNDDWVYCGYFKLNEETEIDTIIGYFDGTGYYGKFDPSNPAIGYRMNIFTSTLDGTYIMPAVNSFDGDVFCSDTMSGTFSWSDTGEYRKYSGWSEGYTDPIYRLVYELDSPITLSAGEYFFNHEAIFVMPPEVMVNADWASLANGELVTVEDIIYTIGYNAFADLQDGVTAVAPDGIVHVLSDLVTPAQVAITKSMDIIGDGTQTITMGFDTGVSGDSRGWFLVSTGAELDVEGLTFDGVGHLVYQGFRHRGFGSFTNCAFENIKHSSPYNGMAIAVSGDGALDVSDCTFHEIGRLGILYYGSGVAGSTVTNCVYTGKGDGDWLDYFLDVGAGASITVDGCTVTDNRGVATVDGSTSGGILVTDYYGTGTAAVIENSTLTGNTTGVLIGYGESDASDVTVHNCDLSGNTSRGVDLVLAAGTVVDASGNFWGDDVTDAFDTQMDYSPYQLAAFDMSELQVTLEGEQVGSQGRIQEAIEMVSGSTIYIAAGLYNENIDVNVAVELIGEGSGLDPMADTILTQTTAGAGDTKVGVVQLSASGASASEPILLKDMRIAPVGMAGISVGRFTEATGTSVAFVELDNVKVVGTNTNPSTEQERGLYVDLTSTLSDVVITGCAFDNLTYGWYFQKAVSADASTVQDVSVADTTFNHNNHKGIYVEKLSGAAFENCTIDSNGYDASILPSYFAPWSAGVDINLKAGTYSDLSFECCTVTANGLGGAKEGVGLTVKGRDDGATYGAFPAVVDDVAIIDCTVTGNERGIRLGEPGKGNLTPTNVVISGCSLHSNVQVYSGTDGSAYGDLINMTQAAVDARNNYWGGGAPGASQIHDEGAGVDFGPYLLTAPEACGTPLEPSLTLTADSCFMEGDQVIVTIELSNALQEVLGGQFFLNYDTSALDFVSAAPGAPFTNDMTPIDNAGMITYRVEVVAGSAGHTGAAPIAMATLTFDLVDGFEDCDLASAVTFAPAAVPYITRLTTPDPDTGAAPLYAQLENLSEITIDITDPTITAPANVVLDADENCQGLYDSTWVHTFDTAPVLLSSPGYGGWYVDRYAPAIFTNADFDGDMRLKHGVNEADSQANRPGGYSGTFYNNQGRKYNFSALTPWMVQVDLYVPADWQTHQRQAGIWGTTLDAEGSLSGYPIIAYTEGEGFQYFDDEVGGYHTIVPAAEITYDSWYTLKFNVESDEYVFTVVGPADTDVITLSRSDGHFQFTNVILNVYNFGETYDVYWDNLILGPNAPDVSDNCGVTSVTYERQDNPALSLTDPFEKGDTEIIWTAADCAGNTASAVQTITVEDNEAPTMACPADINVENDEGLCEAALTIPVPDATDNCDDDVLVEGVRDDSQLLSDPYPVGTTTITWTATDEDANETVCTQLVIVADTESPELTKGTIDGCYPDAASAEAAALAATTVEDNCDPAPIVTVATAGDCNAIVTVTAEDLYGNIASVGYSTTIDSEAPAIEDMDDIIVNAAAGSCNAVVTWDDPVVTDNCPGGFFDDFESGLGHWNSYNSNISLGGTAGSMYGVITPPTEAGDYSGVFSRLGGYETEFNGGYVVELDIFMDMSDPAVVDGTYGWDLSQASNRQVNSHLRDFIFHTASYGDGRIYVAGSNNSGSSPRNDLAGLNHYEITTSGWYTFQWVFREALDGSLAVDLNLVDGGTVLWTETRNNPADDIATTVGGHRYLWFTFLATDSLFIDNAAVNPNQGTTTVNVSPASGSTFPIGDTTVTVTATDGCGNVSTETFTVTVNDTTDFQASVQIQGDLENDVTRCITFTFYDCNDDAVVEFKKDMTFTYANNWVATASFNDLLCDDYTCVTAQDELHTLTVKIERDDEEDGFYVEDGVYYANFVDDDSDPLNGLGNALLQGDLYDDTADVGVDFIDIVDVGVYITEWGQVYDSNGDSVADGDTPCGMFNVHADINGNGGIDVGDYAFITTNYLAVGDYPCCSAKGLRTAAPRRSITIAELEEMGLGYLSEADLNGDGILDDRDVKLFNSGDDPEPDPGSTGNTFEDLDTGLSNNLDDVSKVEKVSLQQGQPRRR